NLNRQALLAPHPDRSSGRANQKSKAVTHAIAVDHKYIVVAWFELETRRGAGRHRQTAGRANEFREAEDDRATILGIDFRGHSNQASRPTQKPDVVTLRGESHAGNGDL